MRANHIGESFTKNGHTLTITEKVGKFDYGKAAFVGVWEDGKVSRKFEYNDFKKQNIAYDNTSRYFYNHREGSEKSPDEYFEEKYVGQKAIMNCGKELTISKLAGRDNKGAMKFIGIWDTGEESREFYYNNFKKGQISFYESGFDKAKGNIGLSKEMTCGHILTITDVSHVNKNRVTEYIGKWEDGTVVSKTFTMDRFKRGDIAYLYGEDLSKSRIGLSKKMNSGHTLTITGYKRQERKGLIVYRGIWEDGAESKWFQYGSFERGQVSYNPISKIEDYIGKTNVMNNGLKLTVTGLGDKLKAGSSALIGKWEDGTISSQFCAKHFKNGSVAHSTLSTLKAGTFAGFVTSKKLWKEENSVFYKCKCEKCGIEDILNPQQMMEHKKRCEN